MHADFQNGTPSLVSNYNARQHYHLKQSKSVFASLKSGCQVFLLKDIKSQKAHFFRKQQSHQCWKFVYVSNLLSSNMLQVLKKLFSNHSVSRCSFSSHCNVMNITPVFEGTKSTSTCNEWFTIITSYDRTSYIAWDLAWAKSLLTDTHHWFCSLNQVHKIFRAFCSRTC